MKFNKILNIMLLGAMCMILFANEAKAQIHKYRTTDFAYKELINNNWTDWSEWESSDILVVINLDREIINIYSDEMQEYDIYEWGEFEDDGKGGETLEFKCVNKDGLRCGIRVRKQHDGQLQLYVDFRDIMFVYNIEIR